MGCCTTNSPTNSWQHLTENLDCCDTLLACHLAIEWVTFAIPKLHSGKTCNESSKKELEDLWLILLHVYIYLIICFLLHHNLLAISVMTRLNFWPHREWVGQFLLERKLPTNFILTFLWFHEARFGFWKFGHSVWMDLNWTEHNPDDLDSPPEFE